MITLHEANATKKSLFSSNGLGILKDCISADVTEEINGEFGLELEYPKGSRLFNEIKEERIIVCDVGYEEEQAFRIKKIDLTLTSKKIYAIHIFYDLADNLLEDTYPQNLDANSASNWILSHTQYEHDFEISSNISKSATTRYVRKNPVEALIGNEKNSFINVWGGEIIRNNFSIEFVEKRQGNANKKHIRYRKNLQGITYSTDFSTVGTRIMPIGYDGMLLPEKYINSNLINSYSHPIIKKIEYSDIKVKEKDEEEGYKNLEECYKEMRNRIKLEYENGIDKPTVSSKINFIELSKTEEYKNYTLIEKLLIGDTINVYLEEYNIDVDQRIIKTKYDVLTQKYTSYELGTVKSNYISQSIKQITQIQEILPNLLEQAKENATEQITKVMGGYIYKTRNELFIMDTDDTKTAQKVWRWNLNGLGYSEKGINGPYKLALTQDGQFVADFITTGTMSVDRIEGLSNTLKEFAEITIEHNKITQIVSNTVDLVREVKSDGKVKSITLKNCMPGKLQYLSIKGEGAFKENSLLRIKSSNMLKNAIKLTAIPYIFYVSYSRPYTNYDNYSMYTTYDETRSATAYLLEIEPNTKYIFKTNTNTDMDLRVGVFDEYPFSQEKTIHASKYLGFKRYDGSSWINNTIDMQETIEFTTDENSKYLLIYSQYIAYVEKFELRKYDITIDLGITEALQESTVVISDEITKHLYDEFVYDVTSPVVSTVVRKSSGEVEELSINEIMLGKDDIEIELLSGTAFFEAKYIIQNEYTNFFSNKVEMNSRFEMMADRIRLAVTQGNVLAALNLAIENGQGIVHFKSNQFIVESDHFTATADGTITAEKGNFAGFSMWYDTYNDIKRSWLTKDFSYNGNTYRSGMLIRDEAYDSDFIFAGMPIGSDGSWSTANAAFRLLHNGNILMNGQSHYFGIIYDSKRRAMDLGSNGLTFYLDDTSNNPFSSYVYGSAGTFIHLYSSPLWSINDALHDMNMLTFYRCEPGSGDAQIRKGHVARFYSDIDVWGNRLDGVNYTMHIKGYEVATNASDKRLKDNVKDSKTDALDIINQIKIRQFDWKIDKGLRDGGKHINCGFIAQEVQKIDNTLVHYDKNYDTYQMENLNLIAIAYKAIQQIYKKLEKLENKI